MSSNDRFGWVGGVAGSLFAGDSRFGVFGEDFLPLKSLVNFPFLPLAALLKESNCIQQASFQADPH